MTPVQRLVTFVDIDAREAGADHMSVSARLEAVLADGSRVLLLDGRGWTSALMRFRAADQPVLPAGAPDIWSVTSIEEIEKSARVVVGPDEPFGGCTREQLAADHWAHLSDVLRRQGVVIEARDLEQLPHEVTLSERLLARVRS